MAVKDSSPDTAASPSSPSTYDNIQEALDFLSQVVPGAVSESASNEGRHTAVGLILGSGLGTLVDDVDDMSAVSYADIPHFPASTAPGHAGRLVFGSLRNRRVVMMDGRPHYYEGHSMRDIGFPIYLLKFLGVDVLVITNACGGINRDFEPGTLMIIDDFINCVSVNPLMGENDERLGPRFPDMSEPYSFNLINRAKEVADSLDIPYAQGVYAGSWGPYFETRAEIKAMAGMGADAVGMSTVPETIVANHAGLKCLAIACVTNMATGIQQGPHSQEKVLKTAGRAAESLKRWVGELVEKLPDEAEHR